MNTQDNVFILMGRYLSGESTASEKEQLLNLLANDEQLQQHFEIYKSLWSNQNSIDTDIVAQDEIQAINRILGTSNKAVANHEQPTVIKMQPSHNYKWIWAAAACILIVVSGIFFFRSNNKIITSAVQGKLEDSMHVIVSQKGSRSKNILPDGSTVWLNAGSTLYYKKDFATHSQREVELVGEAFFDVVKNPQRPFIVHAPGMLVKVLGTSFNVRSYPNDKTTETTLIHGKVEVTNISNASAKTYILSPNQKLVMVKETVPVVEEQVSQEQQIVFKESGISTVTAVNKEQLLPETAWKENRLVFKGDTFEELARKLERWYNVSIVFQDEEVKHLGFYGSLENETMEQAFKALQAVASFNYSIKGNEIFVNTHP